MLSVFIQDSQITCHDIFLMALFTQGACLLPASIVKNALELEFKEIDKIPKHYVDNRNVW